MKKTFLLVFGIIVMSVASTSCGPSQAEIDAQRKLDSIRVSDSIKKLVANAEAKGNAEAGKQAEYESTHCDPGIYVVTGDRVIVRKGPSKKASQMSTYTYYDKVRLYKGDVVEADGRKENGYIHVREVNRGYWAESTGWISDKYLRKR